MSGSGVDIAVLARRVTATLERIDERGRYLLLGAAFGLLFPFISVVSLYGLERLPEGAATLPGLIVAVHREQPLLYVIDTAPIFLGLFAYLAGVRQYRLRQLSASLEDQVRQKTEALRLALEQAQQANERISMLAMQDPLTGLRNRRAFEQELERWVRQVRRYGGTFGLLFMDLDGFKAINDQEGHDWGDRYLIKVAEVLRANLRGSDVIARWGGDEFVILLPEADLAATGTVARKLLEIMRRERLTIGARDVSLEASIGLAVFPLHANEPEDLLRRVDAAMYAAKRARDQTPRCVGQREGSAAA